MKYTCEAMRRMAEAQDPYFHPYHRHRKNSTTSTYSDCSSVSGNSSPSSSKMTSPPPEPLIFKSENIWDRLKKYGSEIPKDPIACQILLQSLAHVIELEHQLAYLEEKTQYLQKMRQKPASDTCRHVSNEKVPEDLASVDVTEFKHLVLSAPLIYDSISY